MNYIKMEIINIDGLWKVSRIDAKGKSSITPFGWKNKSSAINYITAHNLSV